MTIVHSTTLISDIGKPNKLNKMNAWINKINYGIIHQDEYWQYWTIDFQEENDCYCWHWGHPVNYTPQMDIICGGPQYSPDNDEILVSHFQKGISWDVISWLFSFSVVWSHIWQQTLETKILQSQCISYDIDIALDFFDGIQKYITQESRYFCPQLSHHAILVITETSPLALGFCSLK